ncbi:MAG TPA: hypothetical protein VGN13_09540 [Solirubrobacteraceae bacterium]
MSRQQPVRGDSGPARPDDPLVLAAVQRASLHRHGASREAPISSILAHLTIARRSGAAHYVRRRIDVLVAAGELASVRRHGVIAWAPTRQGEQRLRRLRDAGEAPVLPESPQHRAWRNARTAAGAEIERFRRRLAGLLAEAGELLSAEPPAVSDAWLELGEQLRTACRLLGSATHCLSEWDEPDDALADVDRHDAPPAAGAAGGEGERDRRALVRRRALRAGRRNIELWRERDDGG